MNDITIVKTTRQIKRIVTTRGSETGWHVVSEEGVFWDSRSLAEIVSVMDEAGYIVADIYIKTVVVKTR